VGQHILQITSVKRAKNGITLEEGIREKGIGIRGFFKTGSEKQDFSKMPDLNKSQKSLFQKSFFSKILLSRNYQFCEIFHNAIF